MLVHEILLKTKCVLKNIVHLKRWFRHQFLDKKICFIFSMFEIGQLTWSCYSYDAGNLDQTEDMRCK